MARAGTVPLRSNTRGGGSEEPGGRSPDKPLRVLVDQKVFLKGFQFFAELFGTPPPPAHKMGSKTMVHSLQLPGSNQG